MAEILHIRSTDGSFFRPGEVDPASSGGDALTLTGARAQTVRGFGACFNELGWRALNTLSDIDRTAVLDELFSPQGGCLNYGRVPIGANDFSLDWYSCDEERDDLDLRHFSVERDRQGAIPFVREACRRQSGFSLFASPWSPPTWMKTAPVYNFGRIRMEPQILSAYARYLLRFVREYAREGIRVSQIHVQNEPVSDQKFPSCVWSGEQLRVFIRDYLGPALAESRLDTELWLGTLNGPFSDIPIGPDAPYAEFFDRMANTVLADPQARRYISGVGLQWGGKHLLPQIAAAYPEMRLMQTESECGDGLNTWQQAEYIFGQLWLYLTYGAEGYTYWNIALAEDGLSSWGWRQNSLVVVDEKKGTYRFTPEFYVMKHFFAFVREGAVRLAAKGPFAANAVAFENPDGSVAVIGQNGMDRERRMTFTSAGRSFSAVLEPRSIHSFLIR